MWNRSISSGIDQYLCVCVCLTFRLPRLPTDILSSSSDTWNHTNKPPLPRKPACSNPSHFPSDVCLTVTAATHTTETLGQEKKRNGADVFRRTPWWHASLFHFQIINKYNVQCTLSYFWTPMYFADKTGTSKTEFIQLYCEIKHTVYTLKSSSFILYYLSNKRRRRKKGGRW